MAVSPTSIQLSKTSGRLAVFSSWDWQQGTPVSTVVTTSSIPNKGPCVLNWGAWKFQNVDRGPGGIGVQAELVYDPSGVAPAILAFINSIFWTPGSRIQIECGYANGGNEVIDVDLV